MSHFAQAAPDDIGSWVRLVSAGGALGAVSLFLLGFRLEWWVTGRVYQRRVEEVYAAQARLEAANAEHQRRTDERDAALERLNTEVRTIVIPAVTRATAVLERLTFDGGLEQLRSRNN